MSSQSKQSKSNQPAFESSPWTEPFQLAQEAAAAAKQAEAATEAKSAPKPADRADEPTHDALSTIFNGR
jgi:hypothetical protein